MDNLYLDGTGVHLVWTLLRSAPIYTFEYKHKAKYSWGPRDSTESKLLALYVAHPDLITNNMIPYVPWVVWSLIREPGEVQSTATCDESSIPHKSIPFQMKKKKNITHCWWECKLVKLLWKVVWWFLKKKIKNQMSKKKKKNIREITKHHDSPAPLISFFIHYHSLNIYCVCRSFNSLAQCLLIAITTMNLFIQWW